VHKRSTDLSLLIYTACTTYTVVQCIACNSYSKLHTGGNYKYLTHKIDWHTQSKYLYLTNLKR
jgi:hypothetical protein